MRESSVFESYDIGYALVEYVVFNNMHAVSFRIERNAMTKHKSGVIS